MRIGWPVSSSAAGPGADGLRVLDVTAARPDPRRLLSLYVYVLVGALAGVLLGVGVARSQVPTAPTITSVTAGAGTLVVEWTAPAGVTGITRYDIRSIRTDATAADKMDDTNWEEKPYSWSSGDPLEYTIEGLAGGVSYDVQVRAANAQGDGAWSSTTTGTPSDPPPVIGPVLDGDQALTVYWSVPLGVDEADITAYDVRYIESDATDKADTNWMVVDPAWTPDDRTRRYVLDGLDNDTGYDVQVRAVTTGDGPWSPTSTGTPAEHGGTRGNATTIPPGRSMGGYIDVGTDVDYFRINLTESTGLFIFTSGDTDTVGELQSSGGSVLESGDDSNLALGPWNFLIWRSVSPGTYYIKVSGSGDETGAYVLHVRTIGDSTGRTNATPIQLDGFRNALIDPRGDEDYFTFTLDTETDVIIRSTGSFDTVAELQDSNGTVLFSSDDGYLSTLQFLIRARLQAGTYYVKARGFASMIRTNTGLYSVHVETVTEPGSTLGTARSLSFSKAEGGRIDPEGDTDYFRIDVAEDEWVVARAVSATVDIDGELLDSGGNSVGRVNLYDWRISIQGPWGFTLEGRLRSGTYYIKVTRSDSGASTTGPYTIRMVKDVSYERFLSGCEGITTSISDPLYGCQWHLNNSGQLGGTEDEDINVEDAWTTTMGAGINVAVVDDGMDYEHEDLSGNVLTSNNHDYTGGSDIFDEGEWHGTAVAGVLAARDNTTGIRGVAPRASIYGYNLLLALTDLNRADAMSRNSDTTAVSNNSWGFPDGPGLDSPPLVWELAVERGVKEGYGGKGVFYAWAGGNGADDGDNSNLDGYPNHYAVTAVCAVNDEGERAWYSEEGANLWVCAPSSDSRRDRPGITTAANVDRYWDDFGGTSSAAPTVAGVAALVRAVDNDLTWRDVKLILAASARQNDASDSGWQAGALEYGSDTDSYRFNHQYGFGVVDAKVAVDLASTWENLPDFVEYSPLPNLQTLTVPDRGTRTSSITAGPAVEFIEFVEINPGFDAPAFRDLRIELVSPSGAVSVLSVPEASECRLGSQRWRGCGLVGNFRFGSARHLGEASGGVWQLRLSDQVGGGTSSKLESWSLTFYGHRATPAAPTLDSVTAPGTDSLTVAWTAPDNTGASDVSSYDVRYIRSGSTGKATDSNWTVQDSAWTSGALTYTISGLTEGVEYDVQVRAVNDDGDGLWSVTATGTPGHTNSRPFFLEGSETHRSVEENTAAGEDIGSPVEASDHENDTFTYSLGGTDAASFDLSSTTGQLQTKAALDYETKNTYALEVSVHDGKDGTGQADTTVDRTIDVVVVVEDVNEPPVITGESTVDFQENATREVARYRSSDPEGARVLSDWEGDDEDAFLFLSGVLEFLDPPDYESRADFDGDNVYEVTLLALTDEGPSGEFEVRVTVTDENEAPSVTGDDAVTRDELGTRFVSSYSATDPEGSQLNWEVDGRDRDDFTISNGILEFEKVPDYENATDSGRNNEYEVTVVALDEANDAKLDVKVTIENVDEEGSVSLSAIQPQAGTRLTATLTDPDGRIASRVWLWERSTNQNSWETVGSSSSSYTPAYGDVGDYLRATASYNDGHGSGKSAESVSSNPVRERPLTNTAPEFPATGAGVRSVDENTPSGRSIGSAVTADDAEGDQLTYSLDSSGAALFGIDERTGQLETEAELDHESRASYTVTVRATDPSGLSDTIRVIIEIGDIDEIGTVTLSSSQTFLGVRLTARLNDPDDGVSGMAWQWERSSDGFSWSPIGQAESASYTPTDGDQGHSLRASVTYTDTHGSGQFAQSDSTSTVQKDIPVRPPPPPPPPSPPSPPPSPPAPSGPAVEVDNEPPAFAEGSRTVRMVGENSPAAVTIGGPLTALDPDGDALTYTLGGPDGGLFDVVASSGQLLTKAPLDFETKSSHTVIVGVRDSKDPAGEADTRRDSSIMVTINVTNRDEPGWLTLSAPRARVGARIETALVDPDRGVTDLGWAWERSPDRTTWTPIAGASTAGYTPPSSDEGQYLRVTASYSDPFGEGKTVTAAPHGPVTVAAVTEFTDVGTGDVHAPAISALAGEDVFTDTGCGEGLFCPHEPLPRWVMAVWMIRLLDTADPATVGRSRFADVGRGRWWIRYAEQLSDRGITAGCATDPPRYCPDNFVTRAQMASFLVRALDLPAASPAGFTDTAGNVHAANIDALAAAGITLGCSTDPLRYCPDQPVTRAQMASFLHRALRQRSSTSDG